MSARLFLMTTLLVACALVAGCGSDSTPTQVTQNEAPILPPQNIVVQPLIGGGVYLSWDANTQGNLAGYNIYREDPSQIVQKLTATPIKETSFLDSGVQAGQTYHYWVTSVDKNGKESTYQPFHVSIPTLGTNDKRDRES